MTSVVAKPDPGLSGDDGDPQPRRADVDEIVFTADATRANVQVRGPLTCRAVARLAECLDLHLEAGRRFVRVNLSATEDVEAAGLELLARVHHALLARRGTLIITGVGSGVLRRLADAGLDQELFVIGRFADEPV